VRGRFEVPLRFGQALGGVEHALLGCFQVLDGAIFSDWVNSCPRTAPAQASASNATIANAELDSCALSLSCGIGKRKEPQSHPAARACSAARRRTSASESASRCVAMYQ